MDRVVGLCALLADAPGRRSELAAALSAAVRAAADHFAGHLADEEAIVFPAVRRHLPRDAQRAVISELRGRRAAAARAAAAAQSSR